MINENELTIAYFTHDICPRNDLEIMKIINQYGTEGYGIFWILVEILHQNNNKLFSDDIQSIIQAFNLDEEKTYGILTKFKLFKHDILNGDYYYSERVGRNLEIQSSKRTQKQKAIQSRWNTHREKQEIQEFYKEEYKKVFDETPTLMPDEVNTLYEISKTNSDFREKLPKTLERLSKIKFDKNYKHTPLSSWLLKENHYSSVANGEFTKKEEDAIKRSIAEQTIYKPPQLTEEEKKEADKARDRARILAEELKKNLGNKK